jgi:hypothetical protein
VVGEGDVVRAERVEHHGLLLRAAPERPDREPLAALQDLVERQLLVRRRGVVDEGVEERDCRLGALQPDHGPIAVARRDPGLPRCDRAGGDDGEERSRRRRDLAAVAEHELARAVPGPGGASADGATVEVAPEVVGEGG